MNDDKLMKAAGQLSTEISPERDLWPDIATRQSKDPRHDAGPRCWRRLLRSYC